MMPTDPQKWVDLYADQLYSYALMKTGNREQAEDLVQETFLSAYKNKDSFRGDSAEKTWLFSILKNKIIDYYRSKKQHQPLQAYLDGTQENFEDTFFEGPFHRWKEMPAPNHITESPETWLFGKEFRKFLEICLAALPMRIRDVFMAKYLDDKKPETICKENEISSSNYWTILFRAKVLLRACLEKKGVTP